MKYELWMSDPSDGYMLIREDNHQAQEMALAGEMAIVWSVVAQGNNEANQLLYDYLGFGTYRPMLDDHGRPYPQDEDDTFVEVNATDAAGRERY